MPETDIRGISLPISEGCPPEEGRLHTCYSPVRRSPARKASFPPDAPRLACVKPAASVHPEPGSNSPLLYLVYFSYKIFSALPEGAPTFVCLDPSVLLLSWNLDGNCSFLYSQLDCFQSRCLSCGKISLFYSHRDSVSTERFSSLGCCVVSRLPGCKVITFFRRCANILQQFFNKRFIC